MFSMLSARTLRLMFVALLAGLVMTAGGCSLFKKKAPSSLSSAETPRTETPFNSPDGAGGAGMDAQRMAYPTETAEFSPESGVADVHFDYDKSDIRQDQLSVLDTNIRYFKSHSDIKIMIEGHTDERGTTEYNFALGQRRAAAVQDYLMKSGIPADRLFTVSKGKDQPLDPGHSESAFSKNRRGHFMRVVR